MNVGKLRKLIAHLDDDAVVGVEVGRATCSVDNARLVPAEPGHVPILLLELGDASLTEP